MVIKWSGRTHGGIGLVVPLILLLFRTSVATAQLPTATILGVVKDATGAVVPDASLTARNTDTGQTRTAVSAADGSYRFSALAVGNYEVLAEQSGFQTAIRRGLTLTVAQEAVVNFTLEVGAVTQTIAVTAEASLVNTTSGSLGGLVNEQRVADLPLNGRNYIDLTLLQTGISQHRSIGTGTFSFGTWFSSNGAPMRSNNYMLDGASMANLFGVGADSISSSTLGVEGIREFRVVTNSFSAEYGMTMGSQMTIVSKSGTNTFHGSAFEFLRNDNLDARNFFDRKTPSFSKRLPAFVRNNFGGSFGGPVKKDKTFFFGVYEGLRERLGTTNVVNTIPPSAKVDGGLVPQIAAVVKPLLTLFPDPNLPNDQFTFPFSQPTNENYGQIRVDQTFSEADTLFGRYTIDDTEQTRPLFFPQFKDTGGSRSQFATLSESHVFSPTLLNTFRFSFSRTNLGLISSSGIIGPQFSFTPGQEIGQIFIGGITGLGAGAQVVGPNTTTPINDKQNIFTWSDDLFYTRGRHSLKFGTLINRFQQFTQGGNSRGSITFANVPSFLQARPNRLEVRPLGSIFDRTYHHTTLGFYAQDDLRVRSNLTLNLGLRYEFHTDFNEVNGRTNAIRDLQNDANVTLGRFFKNPSRRNLSPRFGFAWDVRGNGKTAVRGGFGLLYDVDPPSQVLIQTAQSPPFVNVTTLTNPAFTIPFTIPSAEVGKSGTFLDFELESSHVLQYNLAVERELPFQMVLTLAYAGSRGINLIQNKEGNPTVPQVLPDGRQFWPVNAPRTNPNFGTLQYIAAAGNSWYNSFQFGLVKRLSKGLQFQSSYTWSKLIDETSGVNPSDSGQGSSARGSDPTHRKVDRGPAAFDITQNLKFNAIYRLPDLLSSGGVAGTLLNGWWLGGILTLQSGEPFTPTLSSNRSRSLVDGGTAGIDRPDLAPGRNAANVTSGTSVGCFGFPAGTPIKTTDHYFDPCAFTVPAAGFLGTAGRNIFRGPGFANLDFSLVKDTALRFLGESGKLEFRAEFFNILNRANFSLPNRTVFAARSDVEAPLAAAGRISSTLGTSRQIQLSLKILF